MDVRYINPFLSAIRNVFEKMLGLPFQLGKPQLKQDSFPLYDVSAFIGLSGTASGCVVLCLAKPMALSLASALCQDDFSEVNSDVTDALGEIANMIAGNAKKDFPGDNNSISIPSVILGKHKVKYPSGVPIIAIPCETSSGRMVVDVAIRTPALAPEAQVDSAEPAVTA